MPSKPKKAKTAAQVAADQAAAAQAAIAQAAMAQAVAPLPPIPLSAGPYKDFLDQYIVGKKFNSTDAPNPLLTQAEVDTWQGVNPATDEGKIIEEIASKFNNQPNKLGIPKIGYINNQNNGFPYYHGDPYSYPESGNRMNLKEVAATVGTKGPAPRTVAHELIHANDHQIDNLNPEMWKRLKQLAIGGNMNSFREFLPSLRRMQDKIDPGGDFKREYAIDSGYIQEEMAKVKRAEERVKYDMSQAQNVIHQSAQPGYDVYKIPKHQNKSVNWQALFDDVNSVLTSAPIHNQTIPNQGFFFAHGSEFPAFMSERLTSPWDTQGGPNPLKEQEAKTLYNMLGDMGNAYPEKHPPLHINAGQDAYPKMNSYIHQRRNSMYDAFHHAQAAAALANGAPPPPKPPAPAEWLSHGGRVTRKNLLSRFIKPKRKAS